MMLAITRRFGEAVWIGGTRISVIPGRGNRVVLGIDAPSNVHVVREEILEHDGSDVYGVKRPVAREMKNAN
jgi:carbon storage regulator CsrA